MLTEAYQEFLKKKEFLIESIGIDVLHADINSLFCSRFRKILLNGQSKKAIVRFSLIPAWARPLFSLNGHV